MHVQYILILVRVLRGGELWWKVGVEPNKDVLFESVAVALNGERDYLNVEYNLANFCNNYPENRRTVGWMASHSAPLGYFHFLQGLREFWC